MLFNIGFDMATYLTTQDFWNCFIFHDVDLLPEDDRNLYTCPTKPRQMAVGMRVLRFLLLSSFSACFGFSQNEKKAIWSYTIW